MGKKKLGDFEVGGCSGVKRVKYRTESDDNFVVMPSRAVTKATAVAICASENEEPDEGSEQRRVSPKWLVDAMRKMNSVQKTAVESMGFGQLFHLRIEFVPAKILSWCLDRFQPVSCTFVLPNNHVLRIEAEDVFLIFGFPKGSIRIDKKCRTQDTDIVEEWAAMFSKKKTQILPSDVVSAMLGDVDGGVWFKKFRTQDTDIIVMADKLLHILRVKYCKTLLTTDANHKAKENLMRVEAWTKGNRHVVENRKGK